MHCATMLVEVPLLAKAFAARVARKRSLAFVHGADVLAEVGALGEAVAAAGALVAAFVGRLAGVE